jgi:epsilon-lactone hydrolase
MMLEAEPVPAAVALEEISADGVDCTWFRAADSQRDAVILYIHGGGFMWGSPRSHAGLISRICLASGLPLLGVDYRETPEHIFPAALDDCATAYQWLCKQGFSAKNLVLVGDSAGGGLVLSLLARLKADGQPLPAGAATSSAFTDLTLSGDSMQSRAVLDPLCTETGLRFLGDTYASDTDLCDPTLSPLFADYAGMPPLLLQVGDREVLLDDSCRVADKARAAGVDVTLEVYEGAVHLWQWFGPEVPESIQAVNSIAQFARRCLGRN